MYGFEPVVSSLGQKRRVSSSGVGGVRLGFVLPGGIGAFFDGDNTGAHDFPDTIGTQQRLEGFSPFGGVRVFEGQGGAGGVRYLGAHQFGGADDLGRWYRPASGF